jgi:hypothetical protein
LARRLRCWRAFWRPWALRWRATSGCLPAASLHAGERVRQTERHRRLNSTRACSLLLLLSSALLSRCDDAAARRGVAGLLPRLLRRTSGVGRRAAQSADASALHAHVVPQARALPSAALCRFRPSALLCARGCGAA